MASETITRNDLKAVLDKVLTVVPSSQIYEAAWTATSSNANLQQVSDSITIPAGTYIFSVKIPVCSQNSLAFCIHPFDLATGGWFGAGQVVQNYIYKVPETTTCYIATSMSTATNYTYIERGFLKAIRILLLKNINPKNL